MPHSLHHITAIAGDPQQNVDFYTGVLGMNLVKKTVNFDDPSTYHLFYGDAEGNPGSILSFFADERMARGAPDNGQAVAVSLSIPTRSIDFWVDYLGDQPVDVVEPFERFGQTVIGLQDPDGLFLELISDPAADKKNGSYSLNIPAQHAIRGLHGVTLATDTIEATGQLLQESLGFEESDQENERTLFQSDANLGASIELMDGTDLNGEAGKGTVHHIAFRAEDEEEQLRQKSALSEIGYYLTEIEDRLYFQSFFFHEPGGALLEFATDNPGFTVDEKPDELGKKLCLPPNLEAKRSLIEAELPKIN